MAFTGVEYRRAENSAPAEALGARLLQQLERGAQLRVRTTSGQDLRLHSQQARVESGLLLISRDDEEIAISLEHVESIQVR